MRGGALARLSGEGPWNPPAPCLRAARKLCTFLRRGTAPVGPARGRRDAGLDGDRLVIKGKREEERRDEGTTYYAFERSFGSFTRAFTLPSNVDASKAKAELKEGVLMLNIPKKPESKPRTIAIAR